MPQSKRFPWRPVVYGAIAGLLVLALAPGRTVVENAVGLASLVFPGIAFALALRWWFGGWTRRPGKFRRLGMLLVAGTLLGILVELIPPFLKRVDAPTDLDPQVAIPTFLLSGLFLGGFPALLVGAWSEKEGLRSGIHWWILRGLGSGVLWVVLGTYGVLAAIGVDAGPSMHDWTMPFGLLYFMVVEAPFLGLFIVGNSVGLALVVGLDTRRRIAPPGGPAAAGPSPAPSAPEASDGPGFHGAVPGVV